MKFLCTLLAFLVLTLSVQPVCASISSEGSCCSESSHTQQNEEEDAPKDCSSACNPFQVCGCCAFSVVPVVKSFFISTKPISYAAISWAAVTCPFIEAPVLGFWQPPKIA